MISIKNIKSRKGNSIPNQFIITGKDGVRFQSYDSTIVFISNDSEIFLDENKWNCSQTTSKYRNIFFKQNRKQTEQKIESGFYTLVDLN